MTLSDCELPPVQLQPGHDRSSFDCAAPKLTAYLKTQARRDHERRITNVYVSIARGSSRIVGFYTLSNTILSPGDWTPVLGRGFPDTLALPATLLGRFAVDRCIEGKGLGRILLMDALTRAVEASQIVASTGIVLDLLDPYDAKARAFYAKRGFLDVPGAPRQMVCGLSAALALCK